MRAIIKIYDFGIFLSIANVLNISQDLKGLGNKVYYCHSQGTEGGMLVLVLSSLSFIPALGPQPLRWGLLNAWWVCPPQVSPSGNNLTDSQRLASVGDLKSHQADKSNHPRSQNVLNGKKSKKGELY